LTIRKGETIAVVGPSGGGKTTLLNLILRLYDPDSGGVYLDGTDVRLFTGVSYRSLFGVVPQEAFLFNDTIRENVLFGRSFDPVRLEHASRIARLEDMLAVMPDGWDTQVGDRGDCVSGGQRQRIALARAVYGMPSILVLDEATSALDAESEEAIQSAMSVALQTMTGIVVAHRLATVVRADRIVVLDAGRIHAVGTHAELVSSNHLYKRLYELQFSEDKVER
jgi:ABC-type multidrug transport system fused ATPase/permease subunit